MAQLNQNNKDFNNQKKKNLLNEHRLSQHKIFINLWKLCKKKGYK